MSTACPHCGAEVLPSFKFCAACGAAPDERPAGTPPPGCPGCGVEIDPAFQFCAGCGLALPVVTVAPRRRSWRWPAAAAAVVALVAFAGFLLIGPRVSFGPSDAANLPLTVAPGVVVEILPAATSLHSATFDDFDVSPEGIVIVRHGQQVVEMLTGIPVFDDYVDGFAFVSGALVALKAGRIGYYKNGAFEPVLKAPFSAVRLSGTSDGSRLLLHRQSPAVFEEEPALLSLEEKRGLQWLSGSQHSVAAAAGDSLQTYFSIAQSVFRLDAEGDPELLLTMPEEDQEIVGMAVAGPAVFFATRGAVYMLQDDIVVPMVLGTGGKLRIVDGAIYVLGEGTKGRVYRIVRAGAAS